jgi:hypothetical protein
MNPFNDMLSEDEQDYMLRNIESFHEDFRYRVPKKATKKEGKGCGRTTASRSVENFRRRLPQKSYK